MTMQDSQPDGAAQTQILLELGKQTTKLEVINTKLDQIGQDVKDHETRIRENTSDLAVLKAQTSAGRDMWARILSVVAVLAAAAASIADYVHR